MFSGWTPAMLPAAAPQAPATLQVAAIYPATDDAGLSLKLDMLGGSTSPQHDISRP